MSPQTARSEVEAPSGADTPSSADPAVLRELEHVASHTGKPDDAREAPLSPETRADVARWLDWQCQMLAGVQRGVVFLLSKSRSESLEWAGVWPKGHKTSRALRHTAERAVVERRSVIKKALDEVGNGTEVLDFLAQPLVIDGKPAGAVSLALEVRSESQRRAVLQLLEWGTSWLDRILQRSGNSTRAGSSLANEAIERLTQDFPLPIVGFELANLLAERLDCARVAIGLADGLQVRLLALSHQIRFDRRVNQVTEIEAAMEECADQATAIALPFSKGEDRRVSQAHAKVLHGQGSSAICSVPLVLKDRVVAVITLVRDGGHHFEAGTIEILSEMAERLAPVLDLKRREAKSGFAKIRQIMGSRVIDLVGGGHVRTKLVVAFAIALFAGLVFIPVDMKVTARSTIEGRLQQVVAAPFAGYILEAAVRAGDQISEGEVLARIDDRELLLEQEKLLSEREKQRREYQEALASRERAKVSVIQAQIDQTEAQLRLVEDQLSRTAMAAPFSGTVVSGDLSRSLGAPVERGQPLFELVPDDGYRVEMQVDEYDVAMLEPGQRGSLRLAGLPDHTVEVEVSRIVPIADARQGGNQFRVEGEIVDATEALRPGMQGVAKVVVGQSGLWQAWTRDLVQRLRLWAWSAGF